MIKVICSNGGYLHLSQTLVDAINIIKTNQSRSEDIQCILYLSKLVNTSSLDAELKSELAIYLDSLKTLTESI